MPGFCAATESGDMIYETNVINFHQRETEIQWTSGGLS